MGHVWKVAHHELRIAWRDRGIVALAVVLTGLLGAATATSLERFARDAEQRARYQQLVGAQFDAQPDRHPHRVSHYGYLLFRPRAPLGAFDSGVERFAGTSVFLEAHRQNTANFSDAAQGGSVERFGELTPAVVLQLFVPLFLLVVAAVSVTREREAGTLSLLVSQGASWGTVLRGKWVGTMSATLVVLLPGLVIAFGWLLRRGGAVPGSDGPSLALRIVLLVVLHLVFWGGCSALGIVISARHRTSRGALATALGLWVALWIVVPRLVPAVATALIPLPSRAQFDAAVEARVRELGDAHNPDDPVFARLRAETLQRHGVARVEDLPINYAGLVMREGERHSSEAFREHMEQMQRRLERQVQVVEAAGLISPFVAVRSLSMAIAGADLMHVAAFEEQAEAYRYALIQALNDLHMRRVDASADRYGAVVNGAPSRQRIDRDFFKALPRFRFSPPAPGAALRARTVALLAFAASCTIMIVALRRVARRDRVTGSR